MTIDVTSASTDPAEKSTASVHTVLLLFVTRPTLKLATAQRTASTVRVAVKKGGTRARQPPRRPVSDLSRTSPPTVARLTVPNRSSWIDLPDGDLLICAGDITANGNVASLTRFARWMQRQPHAPPVEVSPEVSSEETE